MTDHFAKIHSALLSGRLGDARQALDDALLAARRGEPIGSDMLSSPASYPGLAFLPASLSLPIRDRIAAFNDAVWRSLMPMAALQSQGALKSSGI